MARPIKIFISYARKDQDYLVEFRKHLQPLVDRGLIEPFDDRQLALGDQWDGVLRTKLGEAELIVFLVSADFVNSEYIKSVEIKEAMARARGNDKSCLLMPVVVRPVLLKYTDLSAFKAYPSRGAEGLVPVRQWDDRDAAYAMMADEIGAWAEKRGKQELAKVTPQPPPVPPVEPVGLSETTSSFRRPAGEIAVTSDPPTTPAPDHLGVRNAGGGPTPRTATGVPLHDNSASNPPKATLAAPPSRSGGIQLHEIGTHSEPAAADVIFLHGLGGDWLTTWAVDGRLKETFWPAWLAEDLPADVAIWSAAMPTAASRWLGRSMSISAIATAMLDRMALAGLGKRPVVFICHSLGGLVAKAIVQRAKASRESRWLEIGAAVRGICFLATPHTGAGLAVALDRVVRFVGPFGLLFRVSRSLYGLRANDETLAQLNDDFRERQSEVGFRVKVYFEGEEIGGRYIVDPPSSNPGIQGVTPIQVPRNHIEIAKPNTKDDQVYEGTLGFVRDALGLRADTLPVRGSSELDGWRQRNLPRPDSGTRNVARQLLKIGVAFVMLLVALLYIFRGLFPGLYMRI